MLSEDIFFSAFECKRKALQHHKHSQANVNAYNPFILYLTLALSRTLSCKNYTTLLELDFLNNLNDALHIAHNHIYSIAPAPAPTPAL